MFLMVRQVFLVVCLGMVQFCAGLLVSSERVITACGISGMREAEMSCLIFCKCCNAVFAVVGLELVCF